MDQRDDQLQSPGICHKLFYFIMKTLVSQATKIVTLGDPTHCKLSANDQPPSGSILRTEGPQRPEKLITFKKEPASDDESTIFIEEVDFDVVKSTDITCVAEEKARELVPSASVQKQPAKKIVSIKEEIEVIDFGKKRRKLALKKSSMKKEDDIELRPLKSILRVGSNHK